MENDTIFLRMCSCSHLHLPQCALPFDLRWGIYTISCRWSYSLQYVASSRAVHTYAESVTAILHFLSWVLILNILLICLQLCRERHSRRTSFFAIIRFLPFLFSGNTKRTTKEHGNINKYLRQDPLEAILVIFGRRTLIFFCLKALGKKWKMTPLLCACAVVIILETQKCQKRAPRSVEFNFFY